MAPSAIAKAAGVSASSFLDLKAELAKKESEFTKKVPPTEKVRVHLRFVVTFNQEIINLFMRIFSDRWDCWQKGKGTVWARTNKGVAARAARDLAALAADRATAESARVALERKAKIYEKLRRGKTGGLTEAQLGSLLVDVRTCSILVVVEVLTRSVGIVLLVRFERGR